MNVGPIEKKVKVSAFRDSDFTSNHKKWFCLLNDQLNKLLATHRLYHQERTSQESFIQWLTQGYEWLDRLLLSFDQITYPIQIQLQYLQQHDFSFIGHLLSRFHNIKKLRIMSSQCFADTYFIQGLSHNRSISEFELEFFPIALELESRSLLDGPTWQSLFRALKQNKRLTRLSLSHVRADTMDALYLKHFVDTTPCLIDLNLHCAKTPQYELSEFIIDLLRESHLEFIRIQGGTIHSLTPGFLSVLAGHASLRRLTLPCCLGLEPYSLKQLYNAFEYNPTLISLRTVDAFLNHYELTKTGEGTIDWVKVETSKNPLTPYKERIQNANNSKPVNRVLSSGNTRKVLYDLFRDNSSSNASEHPQEQSKEMVSTARTPNHRRYTWVPYKKMCTEFRTATEPHSKTWQFVPGYKG